MPSCRILFVFLFILLSAASKAGSLRIDDNPAGEVREIVLLPGAELDGRPMPQQRLQLLSKKVLRFNRKLTAAVLAFPFPFGIVGLHRIYLGCAPYVPFVYIASLGGACGVLPLMDFIAIITAKDVDRFTNSDKVFMWVE